MKHLFSISFLLVICFSSFAQKTITPYEDYRTCLTGFISTKGDTLWKPVFEKVSRKNFVLSAEKHFWSVTQNEKEGLLNQKGELFLPCNYDLIRYYPELNYFLIDSAGLSCVISPEKEIVVPYKYSIAKIIVHKNRPYFLIRSNEKEGLLDKNLKVIIPAIFSKIALEEGSSHNNNHDDFIVVQENEKKGAFRWDGRQIFPTQYYSISRNNLSENTNKTRLFYLWENVEGGYKTSIADSAGNILRTFDGACRIQSFAAKKYINGYEGTFVLARYNDDSARVFNAEFPNEITPWMKRFAIASNGLIGKKGDSTYFFDLKLQLRSTVKGFVEVLGTTGCRYNNLHSSVEVSGICYYESKEFKITVTDPTDGLTKEKIFLYSTINHQLSKQSFDKVRTNIGNGKRYHWCYQFQDEQHCVCYILDDSLKVLSQRNATFPVEEYRLDQATPDNAVLFQNKRGGIGLLSIDGNHLIIKPKYAYINRSTSGFISASKNNSELDDYYDNKGNLVLSDVRFVRPAGWDCFLVLKKDSTYSVYSSDFKLLIVNCSDALNADFSPLSNYNRYDDLILIKYGKLYVLKNTEIQPYVYPKRNLEKLYVLKDQFLLNPKNEILFKGRITHFGNNYQVITEKKVLWIQGDGRVLQRIEASDVDVQPKYTFVRNKNLYSIYNTESGQKILDNQPNPMMVIPGIRTDIWTYFPDSKKWMLIDSNGHFLLPDLIDYPIHLHVDEAVIFRRNNLYGLMRPDYQTLLSPENEAVEKWNNLYLFKNGKKWGVINASGKQIAAAFDAISTVKGCRNFAIFNEGKFGVINDSLNWLIPLSSIDSIIQHIDLSIFFPSGSSESVHSIPLSIKKEITNKEIVLTLAGNSYSNHFDFITLQFDDSHFSKTYLDLHNVLKVQVPDYDIQYCRYYGEYFADKYYSAQFLIHWFNSLFITNIKSLLPNQFIEEQSIKKFFLNYSFENNELKSLQLSDLFPDENLEKLDVLIENSIMKKQLFGVNCLDLPKVIETFKRNYNLNSLGITFYYNSEINLTLEYKEIKHLLKHPEAFD